MQQRTDEARKRADEQVAAERATAERDAAGVIEKERRASEARAAKSREEAEKAQEAAEERYSRATELLAEARVLADEAATAAQEAAEGARAQAERIASDAKQEAEGAGDAVRAAEKLRVSTAKTAAAVTRSVRDDGPSGRLSDLTKAELVKLAAAQGIEGRTSKTKTQLVAALSRSASKKENK